jgi:hypothetical protein
LPMSRFDHGSGVSLHDTICRRRNWWHGFGMALAFMSRDFSRSTGGKTPSWIISLRRRHVSTKRGSGRCALS